MKPIIQQILPVYPTHNHIQWTVEDKDGVFLSADILRSTSPGGPFTTLQVEVPSNIFFYQDAEANLMGLSTKYWYIIRANTINNAEAYALSEAKTVEYEISGHRGKIARKARRDLKVALERLNGVKIVILKKKRFGTRCPNCFNPVTKDTVYSNCNTCYGTSYDGGYHDPIYTFGKLDPAPIQSSLGASGVSETAITGLTIIDYPSVDHGDVVVETKTNRRFKVQRKMTTESSRVVVHQDLQVSELSRAASEYLIPLEING